MTANTMGQMLACTNNIPLCIVLHHPRCNSNSGYETNRTMRTDNLRLQVCNLTMAIGNQK